MNFLRKTVAVIMAAAMTLSALPFALTAAESPTVSASSVEAKPGENVEVELSISNNPGIVCIKLTCDYDSDVFKLVEVKDGGLLGGKAHKPIKEVANGGPYILLWYNPTSPNFTANGVIATLVFEVAEDAASGDYDIDISYDRNKKEILDEDIKPVYFDVESGVVTIEDIGQGTNDDNDTEGENSGDTDGDGTGDGNTENGGENDGTGDTEDGDEDAVDLSGVSFTNKTYTYDGKKKTLKVSGLPTGAKVEYDNNTAIDAGSYRAYATVTYGGESVTLSAKLTIKPLELTISGLTAKDKIYDGKTDTKLTGGKLEGVIDGDDVYVTMPRTGEFSTASVGKNKTVTFDAPKLKGDDADNYTLKLPTLKADITEPASTKPATTEPAVPEETEEIEETEAPDPVITPEPWVNPFADVNVNDWFYGAVKFASENGIMNGISDNSFNPSGDITRAMFVTVLHRIAGKPAAQKAAFTDVNSGSWYEDAVNWASANGIVNGTSATTFAPDSTITREQMATILYRYADYKEYDLTVSQAHLFADSAEVADYAKNAMDWAADKGLITGTGDGTTASPKAYASRAQAATILQRMVEKFK